VVQDGFIDRSKPYLTSIRTTYLVGNKGSNPAGSMDVYVLRLLCVR